jgi:hypothetical protein
MKARGCIHIHIPVNISVKEGTLDVSVTQKKGEMRSQSQQNSHSRESHHRSKDLIIVNPLTLG